MTRRSIATLLSLAAATGCDGSGPARADDGDGGGDGGARHQSDGSDVASTTASQVTTMAAGVNNDILCWDCGTFEGVCRNADDGYECGSRPATRCGPTCFDLCVCPGQLECVGSMCEPRACNALEASPFPDCSRCMQAQCCDELESCFADPSGCVDASGDIRGDTPEGRDLRDCQVIHCADACNIICGRVELATDDDDFAECANGNCCDELAACIGDDEDWDACAVCIESGGGELCDAALSCLGDCTTDPPAPGDGGDRTD